MACDNMEPTYTNVDRLQREYFPRKAKPVDSLCDQNYNEEITRDRKGSIDSTLDGYTCYRLQPPPVADGTGLSLTKIASDIMGPPELYQVVKEACAQQNVKWPVECQVLPEPVNHIEDWPLYPEQFYQPTGRELRPQPVGDEMGRIVYQYYPTSAVNYFTRSCVGGNKQLSRDVRLPLLHPDDATLQFESRFESANLAKAVQISECYYELHIRADLYTARHTQWFYFAVSNTRKDVTYRFSIVNLSKGDSLYNHGMRPLLYSTKEAELHNVGWRRCASNIVYFRNQGCETACFDSDDEGDEEVPSYTLTFNVTFPHDLDTVYIAHCFPYTYSLLQQHLLSVQNDPFRSTICRQRILCRSLAGNPIYLLTITGHEPEDEHKKKRAIVLTSRVHPGETPASWIMKGVLDFLTSDHPKAVELRRQFVFKIIPMINPDGVIVGNHRCSLVGRDLNRQYKMVVKEMFPSVWHIKAMVRRLMDEHGVVMFCDFHAHSRKHNIFLYGCENRRNHENHLREQIFPLLLHYNSGDKFSFRNCKFRVQRCKEGTARVVVWMMGVLHSYTLESSFGGASEGSRAGTHFSIMDLISMGKQFSESLCEYFDSHPSKEKLRNRLWTRLVKKGSNADEPMAVDLSDSNSSSDDSERQIPLNRSRRKRLARVFKKKGLRGSGSSQHSDKISPNSKIERKSRFSGKSPQWGMICSNRKFLEEKDITNNNDTHIANNPLSEPLVSYENVSPERISPVSTPVIIEHVSKEVSSDEDMKSLRPSSSNLGIDNARPYSSMLLPFPKRCQSACPLTRFSTKRGGKPETFKDRLTRLDLRNLHDARDPPGSPSTYVDKMGDLISSRLALSDNEDSSNKVWSPKHNLWETLSASTNSLSPYVNQRITVRLDALEPVIAKPRLHDPRNTQRNSKSPVHVTIRSSQGTNKVKSKPDSSHSERSSLRVKKKSYRRGSYDKSDYSNESPNQHLKENNEPEEFNKEKVLRDLLWRKGPLVRTQEPYDNLEDALSSVTQRSDPNKLEESLLKRESAQDAIKKLNKRGKKDIMTLPSTNPEVDEEQLCADIAGCDTLFLDIGIQETPELKAARNLKGKIKKKKEIETLPDCSDNKSTNECDSNGNSSNQYIGDESNVHELPKPKKKIKIVIGKKNKPKSNRRKSSEIFED